MREQQILVTRTSMPAMEEYMKEIAPLWDSHWITNMGVKHREFRALLAEYLKLKGPESLDLLVNGHMSLELTLQAMDLQGEVITTPFTFASTTHAIVRNGLEPVFCDIDPVTFTMDCSRLEGLITDRTCAILPVHVYGNICNVDAIQEIADRHGIKVIYDAAHAFGEKYRGAGVGNFGDASIFSFHATKVYNTIEGGAVVCKTQELYDRLYNLKNFGIRGEEIVVSIGANAKMNEFSAITGLLNLKYIDDAIADRKRVHDRYEELLLETDGIRRFERSEDTIPNYAYYPIIIEDNSEKNRDEIYKELLDSGIHARKYFYPVTADQECFEDRYKNADISVARELAKKIILLPIYEGLKEPDIYRIVKRLTY